jgi:hypothetical protein
MGGKRWQLLWVGRRRRGLGADVRKVRLTSGPHTVFDFFLIYPELAQL